MKKKILITGGAGYLGSVLSTKLVQMGHEVYVIDRLVFSKQSIFHLFAYKNFHFFQSDVRNKSLLKKIIKKVEYIMPLAGLVGAPLCEKNKKEAVDINFKNIIYNKTKISFL